MTRQRKLQLQRIKAGLCQDCGKEPLLEESKSLGAKCLAKRRKARGHAQTSRADRRALWASVDWSSCNSAIARKMKVQTKTVKLYRQRLSALAPSRLSPRRAAAASRRCVVGACQALVRPSEA